MNDVDLRQFAQPANVSLIGKTHQHVAVVFFQKQDVGFGKNDFQLGQGFRLEFRHDVHVANQQLGLGKSVEIVPRASKRKNKAFSQRG